MSKDVLAYCLRAIVRYLDGNYELFNHYRDTAMQLYYEEIGIPYSKYVHQKRPLLVPIKELIRR
jgi:hypothetical protein